MRPKYGMFGTVGPARGFTWDEVRCTDGSLPKSRKMRWRFNRQARLLNKLRERISRENGGKPVRIVVNSWYRSPAYNQSIGGATQSQHVEGRATDIQVFVGLRQVAPWRVAIIAAGVKAFERGGIGWYNKSHGYFTHVDHRPNGPARWTNG